MKQSVRLLASKAKDLRASEICESKKRQILEGVSQFWEQKAYLLSVADWLLEGLNDQGSCRGDDGDLGDTVLDSQLNSHSEPLPFLGCLFCDILSNLLGRQTQGSDLGG
jgi:hypothetical protein